MANKKQCGTVLMSPIVPLIGVLGLIVFGIFLAISLCAKAGTGVCIIFGIFCLMSLFMVLTVNQKIEYSPDGFTYRDMLRITHNYDYSQIKKIRYSNDITIHVGHRIILIDSMADNGRKFARVAMKYSKHAKIITDRQSKLFGGNVKSPEEFIFVYILIGVLPIGMAFWGLIEFNDIRQEDLTEHTGTISEYHFERSEDSDSRLLIRFDGLDTTFSTFRIDENSSKYKELQRDVSDKKVFKVYYRDYDSSDSVIRICQLICDEKPYISLTETNDAHRESRKAILLFSAVLLAVWGIYCAISSYVMCNAEKYSKLVKLFVKPEYIIGKRRK